MQVHRAALLLLLLRGVLDSGMPALEGATQEEDDALAVLLGDVKKAPVQHKVVAPPAATSWVGAARGVLGQHRGLLHAVLCVAFATGFVPRRLAMVLLYAALPLYGVVWNGLPLVPSSGGWRWVAVLAGCVGVGGLLYDAIRGLMW